MQAARRSPAITLSRPFGSSCYSFETKVKQGEEGLAKHDDGRAADAGGDSPATDE